MAYKKKKRNAIHIPLPEYKRAGIAKLLEMLIDAGDHATHLTIYESGLKLHLNRAKRDSNARQGVSSAT